MSEIYAKRIREALTEAVDARKLAEAWAALHPKEFGAAKATVEGRGAFAGSGQTGASGNGHHARLREVGPSAGAESHAGSNPVAPRAISKALSPVLSAFLARAATAIQNALRRVLPGAWTEGWALGRVSAQASARAAETGSAALDAVDWGSWTPGDVEAAYQVAGPGLRDLLASQDVNIKSIASGRLEELGNVLADYIGSPEVHRPLTGPVPPMYSVDALEQKLKSVLDNPDRAYMVAHTEIARASQAAASETYRTMGVSLVRVSTADDSRVCKACQSAEDSGPQPVGTFSVPLHPLCRCATVAVLPALAGAS